MSEAMPLTTPIASYRRRFFAFVVDMAILAVPTSILGGLCFDWAASLGQWGRLIGFAETLLYFTLLESRLGDGQSLGKTLLGIKLVGKDGALLSPAKAFGRALVVSVPYFLNGIWLEGPLTHWPAELFSVIIGALIFGPGGAMVYLVFFNRRSKQLLQDLAAGSFIVRAAPEFLGIGHFTAPIHRRIVIGWLCVCLLGLAIGGIFMPPAAEGFFAPMVSLRSVLMTEFNTPIVGVQLSTKKFWSVKSGSQITHGLIITVEDNHWHGDMHDLALAVGKAVLAHNPDLLGQQVLVVNARRGFDLGTAYWTFGYSEAGDVPHWQAMLGAPAPI